MQDYKDGLTLLGCLLIIIFMAFAGTTGDNTRHLNKVKLYYDNGDSSVEYFTTRFDDIEHHFKNGCVEDIFGKKKICGVRRIQVLEVKRVD